VLANIGERWHHHGSVVFLESFGVKNKSPMLFLAVMIAFSLQGCGDQTLRRISADLAAAGYDVPAKVQIFYEHMNAVHHEMDETELKLRSVPELQGIDIAAPRNLTALYDADDVIKPRVKMATLLSAYCSEIDRVANSRDQVQVDQIVNSLSITAQSIGDDLLHMSAIASKFPVSAISALASPVKTVASIAAQGVFSFMRDNWAKNFINERDQAFEDVCINMKRDLNNVANDAKDRARNIVHLRRIIAEKRSKENVAQPEKDKAAEEAVAAGRYADTVSVGNPADLFDHEKDDFHQLAEWAQREAKSNPAWQFWKK
jgi:esterase/lipase